MAEGKKFSEEQRKKFAAGLLNLTWSLLDKKDRTKEEDDKMIHAAHASRFHWGEIGTSANFERGEWQISSAPTTPSEYYPHARGQIVCSVRSLRSEELRGVLATLKSMHAA